MVKMTSFDYVFISPCLLGGGQALFPSARSTCTAFIPAYHVDTELEGGITGNLSASLSAVCQGVGDENHPVIALYHILDGGAETFYQITHAHQSGSRGFRIALSVLTGIEDILHHAHLRTVARIVVGGHEPTSVTDVH